MESIGGDVEKLWELSREAEALGASQAQVLKSPELPLDPRFRAMCSSPRCPWLGLAPGCPPHAMTPQEFRELVSGFDHVLVFRLDTPVAMLLSDDRTVVTRLLQETSAAIEMRASEAGFTRSKAFAAGSCKHLFCDDLARCPVFEGRDCLFPDRARPSASCIGVDFKALRSRLGWGEWTDDEGEAMSMMIGLVLIG